MITKYKMSVGQKYRRTEFDDDDNASTGDVTSPGVVYNPVIAFRAASMSPGGGPGSRLCPRRTPVEKLLLVVICILLAIIFLLGTFLAGARSSGSDSMPSLSRDPSSNAVAPSDAASRNQKGKQSSASAHLQQQEDSSPHPSGSKDGRMSDDVSKICTTKACVTAASSILNALDETIDPCHDFYQYACGGWIKSNPIPSGESRWDTFGVLRRKNQLILKNLLESELDSTNSYSAAEQKASLYYASCVDVNETLPALGPRPLLDLIWDSFGGWTLTGPNGYSSRSMTSSFNESTWDFQRTLEQLHSFGVYGFFAVWVSEDDKMPTRNILQMDQGGITLQTEQYVNKTIRNDKVLSAYLKFMTDIVVLLGGERNQSEAAMYKVLELEQKIASVSMPPEERRDVERMYNIKTVAELQTIAPFIRWKHYFNSLLSVTSYRINDTELVIVKEMEYIKHLTRIVTNMTSSSDGKQTLHNYMMWHIIKTLVPYLSKPFQDAKKEFIHVLFGSSGEEEHWRYCVSDTESVLGFAVGAMFVREAFDGDSKQSANEMIDYIRKAFKRNIYKLEWMDNETRKAAVDKADAVSNKIGFPEYILNATLLDERYKRLVIQSDDYFGNNVRAMKYTVKRNLDKLRKAPEKNRKSDYREAFVEQDGSAWALQSWTMAPSTINAYYTPTRNEIVFLAGILQAPFFDKQFPKSLNYGAMGVVVGHELTHGFDDQGREYDKSGVLRPWWNEASVQRFKQQAKCIDDQYSSYSAYGVNLRGRQTLGENIADVGGLKSAFYAYTDWAATHNIVEPYLPGVNLTHEQLFFVAFAQVWCTNSHPEDYHMSILADSHSLPMFRVRGPLSNSREFASRFQCAVGTPMNPAKKCEVW